MRTLSKPPTVIGSRKNVGLIFLLLLCFFVVVAATLFAYLFTGNFDYMLAGMAIMPVLVLLIPQVLKRRFDLFEPISFVILTTLLGTTLRTIYIVLTPHNEATQSYLMLNQPPQFLWSALLIITFANLALVFGYLVDVPQINLRRFTLFRYDQWSRPRLTLVLLILAGIALISILFYIDRLGITFSSFEEISRKRRFEIEGTNSARRYTTFAYLLWGARLLNYVFYFSLAALAVSRRNLFSRFGVFVLATGLISVIFPFVTSSRNQIMTVVAFAFIIWHYLRKNFSAQVIIGITLAALLFISVLGAIRFANQRGDPGILASYPILESIFVDRHWLDIAKTAHIVNAVPEQLGYQNGRTMVMWMVAPVPRILWRDKPNIRSGWIIGQEIYGRGDNDRSGVPPGFIAELHWNFGLPFIFIGMFALGLLLNVLYRSFRPLLAQNKNAVLVYMTLLLPLTIDLLAGEVTGTMMKLLTALIPVVVILWFVQRRRGSA